MPTVYARTLRRASELVGNDEQLARLLRVPTDQLQSWLAGTSKPSGEVFLLAVDMIDAHETQALLANRDGSDNGASPKVPRA